jgi:hypothetical protein
MKKQTIACFLFAALLLSIVIHTSCEPAIRLRIKNEINSKYSVLVFFNGLTGYPYDLGDVSPGAEIKYTFKYDAWPGVREVHILVLNAENNVVLYRIFTRTEVKAMGEKITIKDDPNWHEIPVWRSEWGEPPWNT